MIAKWKILLITLKHNRSNFDVLSTNNNYSEHKFYSKAISKLLNEKNHILKILPTFHANNKHCNQRDNQLEQDQQTVPINWQGTSYNNRAESPKWFRNVGNTTGLNPDCELQDLLQVTSSLSR